jgi:hypothetical protein
VRSEIGKRRKEKGERNDEKQDDERFCRDLGRAERRIAEQRRIARFVRAFWLID